MREVSTKDVGTMIVTETCICDRRRANKARLAIIPPVFGMPRLQRLKPRPDLHPKQTAVIQLVKENPNDSYLLTGANGTGKSHIAWALYRYALASHRSTVAVTLRDLLDEFRRYDLSMAEGDLRMPRVRALDLKKPGGKPWFILLDEFEKARPSEFASEQLFNLLDAAKSFKHQVVITSNFNPEKLRAHWGRIDEVWGNSIMTRLWDCRQVELF